MEYFKKEKNIFDDEVFLYDNQGCGSLHFFFFEKENYNTEYHYLLMHKTLNVKFDFK